MKSSNQLISSPSKNELSSINNAQVIYLNKEGFISSSTNTLFSTILLQKQSVFEWSPFLESIFPSLFEEADNEVTQFMRVTTIQNFLPGIYDYTFVKLPIDLCSEETLMWIISDRTECYSRMKALQQIENERMREEFHG